jgi:hypothetical protein
MTGAVDRHPTAAASAATNERLLQAMRQYPGASAAQLASVLGAGTTGMVIGRWNRLGAAGVLVRCADGRWRFPTPGDRLTGETGEEDSEFVTIERSPPMPEPDPAKWVKPINYLIRAETSSFACARFG